MERRHSSLKIFALSLSIVFVYDFSSLGYSQGMPPDASMGLPEDAGFPQTGDLGYAPEAYQEQAYTQPAASTPPQQQAQKSASQDQGAPLGPETVALPEEKVGTQGNWMKKREWLLKTNEANNQIQERVVSINGIRKTYNEKYRSIDEILDEFYKQLGQEQGKLQEIFDGIDRYLEKKKKSEIAALSALSDDAEKNNLQAKIELIEQQINTLKGSLDQLKLDMKSVEDLDRSIAERMKILDEQINAANDEASSAQKKTNDLWYIIDDKKARAYYYEIKGSSLEKIKSIDNYLQNDLMNDFDVVIDTIKTHITKTQDEIKGLEDKGLIIKDRAHRVEQIKLKDLEDTELKKKEAELEQLRKDREKARKAKKPTAWYQDIFQFFIDLFSGIGDFFSSLYHTIFGKPVQTEPKLQPKILPQMPVQGAESGNKSAVTETPSVGITTPTPSPVQSLPSTLPEAFPQALQQPQESSQTPLQKPAT